MRLFTVETTITDEGAAEALADAMDRLQPAPADVALYDDAEVPGSIKVMGQFTSAPDMVVLDVLAVAFGAPPFTLSEQVQRTISALTTLPGEAAARALADLVEAMEPAPYGVGAFEIEDGSGLWEVGAYFLTDPDTAALNALGAAQGARPFVVSEVPDIDWVAKVRRELSPVDAGRFFVFGSHDADKVPAGRIPLQIEATVAFGTGHHNTTLGCLLAFDRMFGAGVRPANVADIGAGTAVLAMAAAKVLPGAKILASDIDPVAVDVARANLGVNGLEGRVACVEAAGFDHPTIRKAAPFDLVFANILKGPLLQLAPDMARHVATGGRVILSGLLVIQAESVVDAYVTSGFRLDSRDDLGDWSALVLRRV